MLNGNDPEFKLLNGQYFVDRDGVLFGYILDSLRTFQLALPSDFSDYKRLQREADFYELYSVADLLHQENLLKPKPEILEIRFLLQEMQGFFRIFGSCSVTIDELADRITTFAENFIGMSWKKHHVPSQQSLTPLSLERPSHHDLVFQCGITYSDQSVARYVSIKPDKRKLFNGANVLGLLIDILLKDGFLNLGRGRTTKWTLHPGRGWERGMEVAGNGVGPFHLGPLTSTPIESSTPSLATRADSLSSENSESSEEDWLIKVCCPGARHRYSKRAHAKKSISSRSTKTGDSSILDKKDDFTEKTELTPTTSYQDYTRVPRQESTDLEWLIRLRCPRAQMEQLMPDLKQSFPGVTRFLSKSQSKVCGASQSEKTKTSESWLTQKHLSIAQDKVDNQSSKEIEERKRKQLSLYLNYCNEKGGAFLESYSPSSYDPFFLKTSPDLWKASVPPLRDPLLKEVEGRYIEASIMQQCETGKLYSSKDVHELHKTELPPLPLGRQLMNPIDWLKIPFQYVESDVRQKSRKAHMRARKGKEQEKARKKEINFLPRASTTRKARNLLSGSKQEMIWV
ncbi:hypothetical protein NXF25_002185 [Crotalus adamanteus]|uniref:Potassium channel tetramerisation-type BTB domain-containing protein n=1 Tax=Crotalus adamanteus TaxID=8729 RepID=A0AAW1C9K4_CROAD